MSDAFVRRDGSDYARAFADLLPTGEAWSRDPETVLMRLVRGQAEVWGSVVDPMAADLLEIETDPRKTIQLLPDWERAYGLPDPCVQEAQTREERLLALIERIRGEGGQSVAFFYGVAGRLGYRIEIIEFSPFMAGVSRAGDTRPPGSAGRDYGWEVGPPEMRFYWRVRVLNSRVSWFRAGSGEAGVDPHVRISLASDLECLIRRYKSAHTEVVFDYSDVTAGA